MSKETEIRFFKPHTRLSINLYKKIAEGLFPRFHKRSKIRYSTDRGRKEHDEGGQQKQDNIEDKSHFVIQKNRFKLFFSWLYR